MFIFFLDIWSKFNFFDFDQTHKAKYLWTEGVRPWANRKSNSAMSLWLSDYWVKTKLMVQSNRLVLDSANSFGMLNQLVHPRLAHVVFVVFVRTIQSIPPTGLLQQFSDLYRIVVLKIFTCLFIILLFPLIKAWCHLWRPLWCTSSMPTPLEAYICIDEQGRRHVRAIQRHKAVVNWPRHEYTRGLSTSHDDDIKCEKGNKLGTNNRPITQI
jgi:hypothetical protein